MLRKNILLLTMLLIIITGCNSENPVEQTKNITNPASLSKSGGNDLDEGVQVSLCNGGFDSPILPNNSYAGSLYCWTASSQDCAVTRDYLPGNQIVCLRGSTGGGDNVADALISSWIKVNPGCSYRIGGWLYRASNQDNVYIDFNDGICLGNSFNDAHASATKVCKWEYRSAVVTVSRNTSYIKVRCVRDGANSHNALFEGLIITEL